MSQQRKNKKSKSSKRGKSSKRRSKSKSKSRSRSRTRPSVVTANVIPARAPTPQQAFETKLQT